MTKVSDCSPDSLKLNTLFTRVKIGLFEKNKDVK